MIGIGRLLEIGGRRLRLRQRMRVVEAGDRQAEDSGVTERLDVGSGIDEESTRRIAGDIWTANGFDDVRRASDKQAAAFERHRGAGVRGDVIERSGRDANRYRASTATAMPIPPPMQSDATP
jgi:hypothetical protein